MTGKLVSKRDVTQNVEENRPIAQVIRVFNLFLTVAD